MPTVETNGIETFYHDYGSGRPIVVLHGATANHEVWAEQLQPLTDEYRVLSYDLRGHGKSSGSVRDSYTFEAYADDLAAFIDALDLDQPVVIGHSLGGMVGYVFASEYPDTLSSLITVGSASPQIFSKRELVFKKGITPVMARVMGNERLMSAIEWGMVKLFGEDSAADTDELQRVRTEHGCDVPEIDASIRAKIMREVQGYFGQSSSFQLDGTPVLMLYGENEPMIEPHADYFEAQLANCRSVEIPGASHNSQADNPEFIRSEIRGFLDDVVVEPETTVTGQ